MYEVVAHSYKVRPKRFRIVIKQCGRIERVLIDNIPKSKLNYVINKIFEMCDEDMKNRGESK